MLNIWRKSLHHVFKALDCAGLPREVFTMGGGTALMHFLNHRVSRDIDVFLHDPQHLNFFLPPLNGYLESIASDYSHLSNFIKIRLGDHEIDFILARNITGIAPGIEIIDAYRVPMDHPFEIVAKKIFYRHDSFAIRDIFDLAVVYDSNPPALMASLSAIDDGVFKSLSERIRELEQLDMSHLQMKNIRRLPGSKGVEGREFQLCIEFADAMRRQGKCRRDVSP